MEKELSSVIRLLEGSAKGSVEELKILDLEAGYDYTIPKPFDPEKCSIAELKKMILQTSFFAAAATKLGLEGCEEVACMAMRHMLYTFWCLYEKVPTLDEPLDGEDLSEDMLQLVKDLCRSIDMLKVVDVREAARESQKSAATAMTVTGQKRKRNEDSKKGPTVTTREVKGTGHKGKKNEENDTEADDGLDDDYDPAKDTDTTSSKDDSSEVKRPAKRRKLSASPSEIKSPPATQTTSLPSVSPNVSGRRSHHQKKACPAIN